MSEQTGAPAVWITDSNGRNSVQLTSSGLTEIAGLKCSRDGQSIAFHAVVEGKQNVYVVSAGGGVPQRLTTQPDTSSWPF